MKQSGCQDVRSQKQICEIDCPSCGEKGGIELFLIDGRTAEIGICDACGFEIPKGTVIE